MDDSWKTVAVGFLKTVVAGLVIAAIITGVLIVGFAGQTSQERLLERQTLYANLAQACVLALPVTIEGRNPDDVQRCFTQYDIEAPILQHDEP